VLFPASLEAVPGDDDVLQPQGCQRRNSVGRRGERCLVVPGQSSADDVTERCQPALGQRLGTSHDAEDRAGGRTVAVGVVALHHLHADALTCVAGMMQRVHERPGLLEDPAVTVLAIAAVDPLVAV